MRYPIFTLVVLLFAGLELGNPVSAAENTYVYILNFDNIQDETATEWLGIGFADKLREKLSSQNGLHIRSRQDLEKIMDDRQRLLSQPRGSNNVLLLGKFNRSLDKISVSVQLIDIATWEELDSKKVLGKYSEISLLMDTLYNAVSTMLKPLLPEDKPLKRPYPDMNVSTTKTPLPTVHKQSTDVAGNIDSAIEDLEISMDIVIGAREEASEMDMDVEGEWTLDLNVDNEEEENPENDVNTDILVGVIETLTKNPYRVKMEKPRFEYDTENDDNMKVIFPVTYALKETILKDMLYSMPYTGLKQDGTLTIFSFNKEKFNFPQATVDKLKYGTYRKVPVIQFVDKNSEPVVVIADTPDYELHSIGSDRTIFVPTHRFSPLVDITVGGWEIHIAMETVSISVDYTFIIDVKDVNRLEGVKLKFILAEELPLYLNRLL